MKEETKIKFNINLIRVSLVVTLIWVALTCYLLAFKPEVFTDGSNWLTIVCLLFLTYSGTSYKYLKLKEFKKQ